MPPLPAPQPPRGLLQPPGEIGVGVRVQHGLEPLGPSVATSTSVNAEDTDSTGFSDTYFNYEPGPAGTRADPCWAEVS